MQEVSLIEILIQPPTPGAPCSYFRNGRVSEPDLDCGPDAIIRASESDSERIFGKAESDADSDSKTTTVAFDDLESEESGSIYSGHGKGDSSSLFVEASSQIHLSDISTSGASECGICKEPLENTAYLRCGHKYCMPCILNWHQRVNCCPICRAEITPTKFGDTETQLATMHQNYKAQLAMEYYRNLGINIHPGRSRSHNLQQPGRSPQRRTGSQQYYSRQSERVRRPAPSPSDQHGPSARGRYRPSSRRGGRSVRRGYIGRGFRNNRVAPSNDSTVINIPTNPNNQSKKKSGCYRFITFCAILLVLVIIIGLAALSVVIVFMSN